MNSWNRFDGFFWDRDILETGNSKKAEGVLIPPTLVYNFHVLEVKFTSIHKKWLYSRKEKSNKKAIRSFSKRITKSLSLP